MSGNRELKTAIGELTTAQMAAAIANPLTMLPAEWRPVVWAFWAQWSHLLKDQLALSSRISGWQERGLTLDELRLIFNAVSEPIHAQEIRFPADLITKITGKLCELEARKKNLNGMMERRREAEQAAANKADVRLLKPGPQPSNQIAGTVSEQIKRSFSSGIGDM